MKKDKGLVRIEAVFFFGIIYRIYSSLCFSSVKSTDRLYFLFLFYVVISVNNPCSRVRMFRISSAVFSQTLKRK